MSSEVPAIAPHVHRACVMYVPVGETIHVGNEVRLKIIDAWTGAAMVALQSPAGEPLGMDGEALLLAGCTVRVGDIEIYLGAAIDGRVGLSILAPPRLQIDRRSRLMRRARSAALEAR